jgi:hypothetical protein
LAHNSAGTMLRAKHKVRAASLGNPQINYKSKDQRCCIRMRGHQFS